MKPTNAEIKRRLETLLLLRVSLESRMWDAQIRELNWVLTGKRTVKGLQI